VADFEMCGLEIFWKINWDQTVGIHNKNLNCQELRYLHLPLFCVMSSILRRVQWWLQCAVINLQSRGNNNTTATKFLHYAYINEIL